MSQMRKRQLWLPSSLPPEPNLREDGRPAFWLAVPEAVPVRQNDSLRGAQVTSESGPAKRASGILTTETAILESSFA